jgi:hypothetical protein
MVSRWIILAALFLVNAATAATFLFLEDDEDFLTGLTGLEDFLDEDFFGEDDFLAGLEDFVFPVPDFDKPPPPPFKTFILSII